MSEGMGKSRVRAHLRNGQPVRGHDRQTALAARPAGSDAAVQAASAAAADDEAARRLAGYGDEQAAVAGAGGVKCSGDDNGGDLMHCRQCGPCRDSECPCYLSHREDAPSAFSA